MTKKKNYTSLSDPEFLESYRRKAMQTDNLQNIWDFTTNIIGHSLIAAVIILGIYLGYKGSTAFTVFCVAAVIYFFSKYCFSTKSKLWVQRVKRYYGAMFNSVLGTGEVLYGRFGDPLLNRRGNISYCFWSICYIPLIPIGCYSFNTNRKMIQFTSDRLVENGTYFVSILRWNWKEILYIYLKNWSFAVMVITVINTIMQDYVNPAIYG